MILIGKASNTCKSKDKTTIKDFFLHIIVLVIYIWISNFFNHAYNEMLLRV